MISTIITRLCIQMCQLGCYVLGCLKNWNQQPKCIQTAKMFSVNQIFGLGFVSFSLILPCVFCTDNERGSHKCGKIQSSAKYGGIKMQFAHLNITRLQKTLIKRFFFQKAMESFNITRPLNKLILHEHLCTVMKLDLKKGGKQQK